MHRTIKPHPHHLRHAARIVAVRLVDLRLQHRPHMSRLNADHRQARFGQNAVKPLRQRSGFQPNLLEAIDGVRQNLQQSFRLTRHSRFPHDLARIIHDADARFLERHIQSSKIVHAALLLRMLEAARCGPRFTISLKRSTLIFCYPQAGRPITPSFGGKADLDSVSTNFASRNSASSIWRASHCLPTIVPHFLERRAVVIALRRVRRLRPRPGTDFVEQLTDKTERVNLIIVPAGRETQKFSPQVGEPWCAPNRPETVWAGAAGGGIWKSNDGGQHWRALWHLCVPKTSSG